MTKKTVEEIFEDLYPEIMGNFGGTMMKLAIKEACIRVTNTYLDQKKEKKDSKSRKEIYEEQLIAYLKPLFDAEPNIKKIPIYGWGRCYKYECAGEPFETIIEEDFTDFRFQLKNFPETDLIAINYAIVKLMGLPEDSVKKEKGKSSWNTNEIVTIYPDLVYDYISNIPLPSDRKVVVKWYGGDHDSAGDVIMVNRTENGLEVNTEWCDSPE